MSATARDQWVESAFGVLLEGYKSVSASYEKAAAAQRSGASEASQWIVDGRDASAEVAAFPQDEDWAAPLAAEPQHVSEQRASAKPADQPLAPEQDPANGTETTEGAEAEREGLSIKGAIPLKHSLPHVFKAESHFYHGCFKAEFGVSLYISGTVEPIASEEAETEIAPIAYDSGKIAQSIAKSWHLEKGPNYFGWDAIFSEVKLEGASKVGAHGLEIEVAGSGKMACGAALHFNLILLKIEKDFKTKLAEFAGGADLPGVAYDHDLGASFKLHDCQIGFAVEFEIKPDWPKVWKHIAKEVAERLAEDAAADAAITSVAEAEPAAAAAEPAAETTAEAAVDTGGETVAAAGTVDLAVAASLFVIALGGVAGALRSISDSAEIAETRGMAIQLATRTLEGFRIGAVGGSAPADKAGRAGYEKGYSAYCEAMVVLLDKHPGATAADIKAAIEAEIDQMVETARPGIEEEARQTVWFDYAESHQDGWLSGSYAYKRWVAWENIFGNDPKGDPRFMKYMDESLKGQLGT